MELNKQVIFVTGALSGGGAEKVMSILASGCADLGAKVTLIILRDKSQTYPVSQSVNLIQIKTNSRIKMLDRIWQLHKILKKSEANTIVPFLPIVTLYTLIANIGVGKKIIMSERADPYAPIVRENYSLKDMLANFLIRQAGLCEFASWTVFQTLDAQAWYSKRIQKRSSIIPNPLDTEKLPERYTEERDKKIVAAGRFSEEKNFKMLINAFSKFEEQHKDWRLTIYGEGNLRGELEKQIEHLGLETKVALPGFTRNLHEEMKNAAMYVSTSNHEGISNSMLEALGMGVPTIVTNCPVGGARMFVRTGENGVIIPMNDEDALVSAMNRIADDNIFMNKISQEATKIREILNSKRICECWLELI